MASSVRCRQEFGLRRGVSPKGEAPCACSIRMFLAHLACTSSFRQIGTKQEEPATQEPARFHLRPPKAFHLTAQGREPCERTLGRNRSRAVTPNGVTSEFACECCETSISWFGPGFEFFDQSDKFGFFAQAVHGQVHFHQFEVVETHGDACL